MNSNINSRNNDRSMKKRQKPNIQVIMFCFFFKINWVCFDQSLLPFSILIGQFVWMFEVLSNITNLIEDHPTDNRFMIVDRPPCRPRLAPIKYVFNELAGELTRRCNATWDINELMRNIAEICSALGQNGNFHSIFVFWGYSYSHTIFSYYTTHVLSI